MIKQSLFLILNIIVFCITSTCGVIKIQLPDSSQTEIETCTHESTIGDLKRQIRQILIDNNYSSDIEWNFISAIGENIANIPDTETLADHVLNSTDPKDHFIDVQQNFDSYIDKNDGNISYYNPGQISFTRSMAKEIINVTVANEVEIEFWLAAIYPPNVVLKLAMNWATVTLIAIRYGATAFTVATRPTTYTHAGYTFTNREDVYLSQFEAPQNNIVAKMSGLHHFYVKFTDQGSKIIIDGSEKIPSGYMYIDADVQHLPLRILSISPHNITNVVIQNLCVKYRVVP
eukprot:190933_1